MEDRLENELLSTFSIDMQNRVAARLRVLDEMIADGRMDPKWFKNKKVIDWEAGDCAFAVALFLRGASFVVAIDTWLMPHLVPNKLMEHSQFYIAKQSIHDFYETSEDKNFDFIFANTVTEHLQNLPLAFDTVRSLLSHDGVFVTNHDNYYQPVGHHDHGMLYYSGSKIVFQGVECWNTKEKCATSNEHRSNISDKYPWTWSVQHEKQRNPEACDQCPYYKRSKPWAHLIYQSDFNKTWSPTFTTHPERGTINKVTPFQLRQFIIEAGFFIIKEHHSKLQNDIPAQLLIEHTPEFLTTSMVWIAAKSE